MKPNPNGDGGSVIGRPRAASFRCVPETRAAAIEVSRPARTDSGAATLSVSCIDGIDGLERFARELDRLNLISRRYNPFLSSAFLLCFARYNEYYPHDVEERLFIVREHDRVVGCAPMRRSFQDVGQGRLRVREPRYQFLAPIDTVHPGFLCAPEYEKRVAVAVVSHIREHERGWGMLELAGQQPGAVLHEVVHAEAYGAFRARDITVEPYNEIDIEWPDVGSYFRSLSHKMRSNVSRQARRLFAAGEPILVIAWGSQATAAWFDAYRDVDRRSWKHQTNASISRDARRLRFYEEVVAGRAGLEPSFVGIVIDDELIAGLIVGSAAGPSADQRGSWFLEIAYDQSRAELGPGQLLLLLGIAEAIERGDQSVSFMQNFAYYKHRWAARPVDVVNVQLIRRMSLSNLRGALGDLGRWWRPWYGAEGHEPSSQEKSGPSGTRDEYKVQHASSDLDRQRTRQLTSAALAYDGPGMRRVDRASARGYLPFPLQ